MIAAATLAFAALLLGGASAGPSPGCGNSPTITSGNYTTTIRGQEREYIVSIPEGYDESNPYSLIFTFHELGGSAGEIAEGRGGDPSRAYYGLPPLAGGSAIFVAPDGQLDGWANLGGQDVEFVDDMVETLEADLCVEQGLRFATGFSYGASMSFSLACSRPDEFRAVAALSGAPVSGCDGGDAPVAYYAQHGTGDLVLNVGLGRNMRDRFVENNGCTEVESEAEPGEDGSSTKVEYEGCDEGYPVTWVVFDGDHTDTQTDPGESEPFSASNTWEFFSQFM